MVVILNDQIFDINEPLGLNGIEALVLRAIKILKKLRRPTTIRKRGKLGKELRFITYRAFCSYRSEFYNTGVIKDEKTFNRAHRASTSTDNEMPLWIGKPLRRQKKFLESIRHFKSLQN